MVSNGVMNAAKALMVLSRRWIVNALSANHSSISAGSRLSIMAGVGTVQPASRIALILCWYRRMRSSTGSSGPCLSSLSFGQRVTVLLLPVDAIAH